MSSELRLSISTHASSSFNQFLYGAAHQKGLIYPYRTFEKNVQDAYQLAYCYPKQLIHTIQGLTCSILELLSHSLEKHADNLALGFQTFKAQYRVLKNHTYDRCRITLDRDLDQVVYSCFWRINVFIENELSLDLLKRFPELRPSTCLEKKVESTINSVFENIRNLKLFKELASCESSCEPRKLSASECSGKTSRTHSLDSIDSFETKNNIGKKTFNPPFDIRYIYPLDSMPGKNHVLTLFSLLRQGCVLDLTPSSATRTISYFYTAHIQLSSGDGLYFLDVNAEQLLLGNEKLYLSNGNLNPHIFTTGYSVEKSPFEALDDTFSCDESMSRAFQAQEVYLSATNSDSYLVILPSKQKWIARPLIGGRWSPYSLISFAHEDLCKLLFDAYLSRNTDLETALYEEFLPGFKNKKRLHRLFDMLSASSPMEVSDTARKNEQAHNLVKEALPENIWANLVEGTQTLPGYLPGISFKSYTRRRYAQNVLAHLLFSRLYIQLPNAKIYPLPVLNHVYAHNETVSKIPYLLEEKLTFFNELNVSCSLLTYHDHIASQAPRENQRAYRQFILLAIISGALYQDQRKFEFQTKNVLPTSNCFPGSFNFDVDFLEKTPLYLFITANNFSMGRLSQEEIHELLMLSPRLLSCALGALRIEKEAIGIFGQHLVNIQNFIVSAISFDLPISLKDIYKAAFNMCNESLEPSKESTDLN